MKSINDYLDTLNMEKLELIVEDQKRCLFCGRNPSTNVMVSLDSEE